MQSSLSTSEGGGAERAFVDVAEGLHRRGHEVKVLTFDYPGEAFYDLSSHIERRDMAFNPAGQPTPRLGLLRALPRMRAAIAADRPEVIVVFMHSTFLALVPALIGCANIPIVFSEHTDHSHYKTRPLQYFFLRLARKLAAITTIPSETALSYYGPEKADNYAVVPNAIDSEYWRSFATQLVDEPAELVAVGRFYPEKDHAVLLDAFARVASAFPEWRLRIVGDGPLRADLEAQAERLGLGTRVEMPGYSRDVGAVYAKARFVVLPSRYESFGMVAAEALATGRAVLSFDDCAGIAEIVESGTNGLLVRGGPHRAARVSALAEGLRQMMGDPDLCDRLGREGPESVARFGTEPVLDRWEDVICQASGRAGQT